MSPVIIGPMRKTIEKLRHLERDLSEENGGLSFFGVGRPISEEGAGQWTVLVAAPWLKPFDPTDRGIFSQKIREYLTPSETWRLSTHLLSCTDPDLETIHEALDIEHGLVETFNFDLFGQTFIHAYIITSKRADAPAGAGGD